MEKNTNQTNKSVQVEPNRMEDFEPKYKNLVLSGGSVKGICHVGALQRLIDEKLINPKKLKALAAASAGSLFGVLLVLGFSNEEIWQFLQSLDMSKTIKPDFFMLLKKCGIDNGEIIHNLYEEILTRKTGIKHINFKQLFEITKIHLTIVGSCLTTKEIIYYDHINTPTFKVSMAIRISISMPGFFTPVVIGNKKYIDGAILNNYPMNLFRDKLDETIGILNCGDYDTNYTYPEEYFLAVMHLFMYHYYKERCSDYNENTVYITKNVETVNIFDFNLNFETKQKLYQCGIDAAEEFIRKTTRTT